MNEEQLKRRIELADEKKPTMKRRKQDHDYHSRRMYMITMTTEERKHLFGVVVGDPSKPFGSVDAPKILPTELGKAVSRCWEEIAVRNPEVITVAFQLMPDHFHGILFVREHLERHLGKILNGFKIGCRHAFRKLCPVEYAVALQQQTQQQLQQQTQRGTRLANRLEREHGILFTKGYNDRILLREGQLDKWIRYLADNPRRLLVKREYPEFFRVQRAITWKSMTFSALGNLFLLRKPSLLQVQCSRRLSAEQIEKEKDRLLAACRNGAVLVSPAISLGEKVIMRAAFEGGYPEIILKDNGFVPLTKPSGASFDACANGQMLFLGPTNHTNERKTISRSQCLSLNDIARKLCEVDDGLRADGM